ncbi:uncharacterized protein LOC142556633 [Primulina tabacum]|uniref:uncharacterized protein LOC142556633 n=1 Tax=Primulina tabacum TaxID=48773 RepID=UPI003F5A04DF
MAVTPVQYAVVVAILGSASFILGVLAELKKPAAGEVITGKEVVICKYPSDPSVFLGYASFALLLTTAAIGYQSLFYPYKGKSIPRAAIFGSSWCTSFFYVSVANTIFAAIFLLWPTITEQLQHSRNIHSNLDYECPTAETGLLGGGAFASLNASLFWLISLMLTTNVREDYFDDEAEKHEII